MKYKPHDYQKYATDFILSHPISAILLQMGLGKSVITLTAIRELFRRGEISRVLVVAPLRVARDTWPEEIRKWDHLRDLTFSVAVGTADERTAALQKDVMIHIINRENVDWMMNAGIPLSYDMIVVDELSSFKSHVSKRFRALMKLRPRVDRIVGLTGTPTGNGLMDLFAEYRLLDLGVRLGKFIGNYRLAYFTPDKRSMDRVYSWRPKQGAEDAIYRKISDITVSMKSVDYLKMPECLMNTVFVRMDEKEREQYETLKTQLLLVTVVPGSPVTSGPHVTMVPGSTVTSESHVTKVPGCGTAPSGSPKSCQTGPLIIDAKNAAALSSKLSQMANGACYAEDGTVAHIHDRKLDVLEDLIESANGNPILIAYWFQHDLARIRQRFPEIRPLRTSQDIRDWNDGKIPVAAIHPASAGHGLNLQQGGSTLVWFGLTWSLELYQQTNARLWRQGQTADTVVIHHIVTKDSIDEQILAALSRKDRTQESLIAAVKAQLPQSDQDDDCFETSAPSPEGQNEKSLKGA